MRESLSERFLDRLFSRPKRKSPKPNCYGLARSELGLGSDEFRDPEQIWDDYVRTDDLNSADILAFLDMSTYLGKPETVHAVANKPDKDGNIRHRRDCGQPVESIPLNELIDYHKSRGHVVVGFKIS
ncbi:MAG: hypothetical protein UX25_C0026G0005 [Candidatus Woesebacteria bacterium GW2011_GWC2_45_9]|uniref:Uncharacterized protein n=1 Tax=Candidatus Woesebacteria bacterium GW2011_GWC2_45_9 TaxID=1618589 RepID=A0A0G1N8S3_9BACT|nr:MAG: hypothetical protein UX25_C0026G0005 [Candidatus Woesebacteria bacterium GW2011_GWC2_45_9]